MSTEIDPHPFSVHEALEFLGELHETEVSIYGALSLDFEGTCIDHLPRAEASGYASSIWVDFDFNALGQNEHWLEQFDQRHVQVTGILFCPRQELQLSPDAVLDGWRIGCGHFGMWPARMTVQHVSKFKQSQRQ